MPPRPRGKSIEEGIIRGLYRFRRSALKKATHHAQIFASGSIMLQALRSQEILEENYGVAADIWSATSYQILRNEALACERWNRLNPTRKARVSYLEKTLKGLKGPIVAASDYMKLVSEQIARWVPGTYVPLGTDGFGLSDTREALRRHFEVDAESIVIAVLDGLRQDGALSCEDLAQAVADLGVDPGKTDPMSI